MKRLYIFLLVLVLALSLTLSGCKKEEDANTPVIKPPIETPKADEVEEEEPDNIIKEFGEVLNKEEEPDKIISFIEDNLDKVSEVEGNVMIDGLERKLENNLDKVTDRIMELDKDNELLDIAGYEEEFAEEHISEIKNEELRAEVQKAYDNMYKLVNLEGQFYPIIDYTRLQKYNDYLTAEWKDYLAIMARDSEDLPMADGGLSISFAELADRLLLTENYLNSYLDGQRHTEVLEMYENKINVYLKGLPNTPIAHRETGIIKPEVLDSYEKTASGEDYMTVFAVSQYLEAIKENEMLIDEDILNLADKLIDDVMETLTEFK